MAEVTVTAGTVTVVPSENLAAIEAIRDEVVSLSEDVADARDAVEADRAAVEDRLSTVPTVVVNPTSISGLAEGTLIARTA